MNEPQANSAISPHELHQLMARQPVDLLDVRSPAEHHAAHVPGAHLVPLDQLDPQRFLSQSGPHRKPIYVLCQSGGRAARAIEKFQRAGFNDCVLVEGGTQAWIEAGLPVNRGSSRVLPLMRQVQIVVGLISAAGAALALFADHRFAVIPLVIGTGLLIAGFTGFCGLGLLLAKMPWNQAGCGSCCSAEGRNL
jgi:rhodanese-related sulfurtransferase